MDRPTVCETPDNDPRQTTQNEPRWGESCDCPAGPTWVPSRTIAGEPDGRTTTHLVTHVCCIRCETELEIGDEGTPDE